MSEAYLMTDGKALYSKRFGLDLYFSYLTSHQNCLNVQNVFILVTTGMGTRAQLKLKQMTVSIVWS